MTRKQDVETARTAPLLGAAVDKLGDDLLFLPLGGSSEIGMNLNLYRCQGKWLIVDLGIGFADDRLPGVDIVLPDPTFIEQRRDDLLAIVLTHAHEDHLGAVAYLWPRLRCPIYATPFTAEVVRGKLQEAGLAAQAVVTEVPLGGRIDLDPFDIEFVSLTHSIPEPNALAIRTPEGMVLHTGDWKIDPDPLIGGAVDADKLRALGDEGVDAMICDSTNVFREGTAGSEAAVRESLTDLIAGRDQAVYVATFASNVARVETVAKAAEAAGRKVVVLGRGLDRMIRAARATGYLTDVGPFVSGRESDDIPDDRLLYLVTGCQGEPRAALARIARGEHPVTRIKPGDTVIFSSKIIPGNERQIGRLQNQLAHLEADVITERDEFVHVSGHAARDELSQMYQWLRPKIAVPTHGEARHLREHCRLARDTQVPETILLENGAVARLTPGNAGVVGHVETGYLIHEGGRLYPADGDLMRARKRMLFEGSVFATVVVNKRGELLADPQIDAKGTLDPELDADLLEMLSDAVARAVDGLDDEEVLDDDNVHEAARLALRRRLRQMRGKKPLIDIHVVRV